MNIKKIYIENFKGIRRKTIIDLTGNQLTILNGPNGFGKTTIFDVIELCLRGRLSRVDKYGDITKNTADYQKAFYQNDTGSDVVLKVCVSDNQSDHIIVKRLDKDNSGRINGGRKFRTDNWQLFETYYTNNSFNFADPPNFPALQRIEQRDIDQRFFPDQTISLVNLFPLFHYLQQEENIYFLKMNEEEKKENLNFLFQTQKASDEFNRTQHLARGLTNIKAAIERRLIEIGQPATARDIPPYHQLVPWSNPAWDQNEPFKDIPGNQLATSFDKYRDEIQSLLDFSKSFDPTEYNKQTTKDKVHQYEISDWLLSTLVVYHFLLAENFEQLESQRRTNERYKKYRSDFSQYILTDGLMLDLAYSKNEIATISASFEHRRTLRLQTTTVGDIIRDLNEARDRTMQKFVDLNTQGHIHDDTNCPLCNAPWPNMGELIESFNDKTVKWQSLLSEQAVVIRELESELTTTFVRPLQLKIDEYLALPEHFIEDAFFAEVAERRGNLPSAEASMTFFRLNSIDISTFQINSYATAEDINRKVQLLRKYLQDIVSAIVVDQSRVQNARIYIDFYQDTPERIIMEDALTEKIVYITEQHNIARLTSTQLLNRRLASVSDSLQNVERVRNQLQAAISDFKKAMIEKIKIPFYIYSGKILQHFQQGYGIFVDVRQNTNRIRFLADDSSDHDAIHQLSTGQLAVVSIAFCLALNKVYTLPSHFKFLAIDDPVQTLDDINIYSLVDLIRHEFTDYQLLISTHDENIANFLKYKFQKFSIVAEKLNVQATFYESQSAG